MHKESGVRKFTASVKPYFICKMKHLLFFILQLLGFSATAQTYELVENINKEGSSPHYRSIPIELTEYGYTFTNVPISEQELCCTRASRDIQKILICSCI